MATATDEGLGDVRRRIARLEMNAQEGTADVRSRMRHHIDALRRHEDAARTSAREVAAAVAERLQQLDASLELAELRMEAELATTPDEFTGALQAELHRWDSYLERMQTKAAAETGVERERAEAAIADLRQRRLRVGPTARAVSDRGKGFTPVSGGAIGPAP